jgi:hypothetical protein
MFQLTNEEFKVLMLQIATSKHGRGGRGNFRSSSLSLISF